MTMPLRTQRLQDAQPTGDPSAPCASANCIPPSLNLYKSIADAASEVVWEQAAVMDAECLISGDPRFICANKCLSSSAFYASIHTDDQQPLRQGISELCAGEIDSFSNCLRALAADGAWVPVEVYARCLRDSESVPRFIVGGFRDLSDAGHPLPRQPAMADVIWERPLSGETVAFTEGLESLLGTPRAHFRSNADLMAFLHPEDLPLMEARIRSAAKGTLCDSLIVRMRHNDGTWRQVELVFAVLREGEPRLIGSIRDITPKAFRNLPELSPPRFSRENGLYPLEAGRDIIEKNLLTGLNLQALFFVDFANFGDIAGKRGERWKQLFLQQSATILRNLARENDIPVQCSEATFLLFADQYETFREITDLARSLHRMLTAACALDNPPETVAFSVGIAIAPYDALTFQGLLDHAAEAASGREGICFYDSQSTERYREDSLLIEEERRRDKEEMRDALQTIMDNVDSYLFVVHPQRHEILFSNKQIRTLNPGCLPGAKCHVSIFHQDQPCSDCTKLIDRDCIFEKDGRPIYLQLRNKRIRWLNNEMVNLICGTDITERTRYARKLEYMAYHDQLLDIPNRTAAIRNLQQILQEKQSAAILLLDIRDFKLFNETFGHAKGDLLLREVSLSLSRFVPEGSLYRFGGDEFLISLPSADGTQADRLARTIRSAFQRIISIEDLRYTCNLDIGISICPEHGATPSSLITHAEMALAQAQQKGLDILMFNDELERLISRRKLLQILLRSALENRDFEVFYQPVFDNATGMFLKAEALLRLRDPSGNFISPAEFIPVAESSGIIVDMGYLVLDIVCRKLMELPAQNGCPFQIAVNLSVIQLFQTNFANRAMEIIQRYGINPQQLEFELTESVLINSFEQVKPVMQQLRNRGIRFALDDFGTGYSSLSYLTHLPINTLKLDRSFIQNLETSDSDREICRSVISIARHLAMSIVAEGVENAEQARIITELGATSIQGFFYAKPMPGRDLVPWLTATRQESRHSTDNNAAGS